MFKCSRCKQTKQRAEFHSHLGMKNGVSNYCRKCASEMYHARRNKNKTQKYEWDYKMMYYTKNREVKNADNKSIY